MLQQASGASTINATIWRPNVIGNGHIATLAQLRADATDL